jgi:hypothetical protein
VLAFAKQGRIYLGIPPTPCQPSHLFPQLQYELFFTPFLLVAARGLSRSHPAGFGVSLFTKLSFHQLAVSKLLVELWRTYVTGLLAELPCASTLKNGVGIIPVVWQFLSLLGTWCLPLS